MQTRTGGTIMEPARQVPVVADVDVVVLGGSCTGVFAAVRAARLGATVAIVEKTNAFGGVATHGLVNVWHSIYDTIGRTQICGGLSLEVINRLLPGGHARLREPENPNRYAEFNSEELKLVLDRLVVEHRIAPFLHTFFCSAARDRDGRVSAAIIENKSGRSAIRAKVFVDATGDGDLLARLGMPFTVAPTLQPPTVCGRLRHYHRPGFNFRELYRQHREEFGLPVDSGWSGDVPDLPDTQLFAETHVFGANCADADQLTAAEIEGRRQLAGCVEMIRKYVPQEPPIAIEAIASSIGIRESRRFEAAYRLTEMDVLTGRPFDDAIGHGSYRVDVHHPQGGGFIFKYLDGTTLDIGSGGGVKGRWREPLPVDPTWYAMPYRMLVHPALPNVIMAGRMVAADEGAFGAIRVMINLNQLGEAAGTAAALALRSRVAVTAVEPALLRRTLQEGGSIFPA